MEINVYEQYFEAEAVFEGVLRKAALVSLQSNSQAGFITYKATVTFFLHRDEEDYAVSYDAYFEKVLYEGKGRRSKKKEEIFLKEFRDRIDEIVPEDAKVFWDRSLGDARYA